MKSLWNATRNAPAVNELETADSPVSRAVGLLGRRALPEGRGLLITKCSSIHMFFMSFAIDAVFLDGAMRVMKIAAELRPWKVASCGGARHTLELPAGWAAKAGICVGDELVFSSERSVSAESRMEV
ncbi:MAG TPA: DUF192 domain-containing protein [Planctomycetota bacterium]|nr:DUF192 domain-containing protein [Planctomycetota bacterium]